jgi:hypothetical protein
MVTVMERFVSVRFRVSFRSFAVSLSLCRIANDHAKRSAARASRSLATPSRATFLVRNGSIFCSEGDQSGRERSSQRNAARRKAQPILSASNSSHFYLHIESVLPHISLCLITQSLESPWLRRRRCRSPLVKRSM